MRIGRAILKPQLDQPGDQNSGHFSTSLAWQAAAALVAGPFVEGYYQQAVLVKGRRADDFIDFRTQEFIRPGCPAVVARVTQVRRDPAIRWQGAVL